MMYSFSDTSMNCLWVSDKCGADAFFMFDLWDEMLKTEFGEDLFIKSPLN